MFHKRGKYQVNGDISTNEAAPLRSYESDVTRLGFMTSSMRRSSNALFHVVGSRKEVELGQIRGDLENEQSVAGQLQKKIKELQVGESSFLFE